MTNSKNADFPPVSVLHADETLDLRHEVLWPSLSRNASRVPGDAQAAHYGLKAAGVVVCCFSVFELEPHRVQIRKFATAAAYQRKGYGAFLLKAVLSRLSSRGIEVVELDARETAAGFYTRNGFEPISAMFAKNGLMHIRMACHLVPGS